MADSNPPMMVSRKVLVWAGVLLATFLLGFLPQYGSARGARQELAAAQGELEAAKARAGLGTLRDLIALVHLEASQKNYGIAGQHSTAFFDRLQQAAGAEHDPERRASLNEILGNRDVITAALASGDAAVVAEIQSLFRAVHAATSQH